MRMNIVEIGIEVITEVCERFPLAYYMRGNQPGVEAAFLKSKIEAIPLKVWCNEMKNRKGIDRDNFIKAINRFGLDPERCEWNKFYQLDNESSRMIRVYIKNATINDVNTSNIQDVIDGYYRFYR